jgi:hypothetical protein
LKMVGPLCLLLFQFFFAVVNLTRSLACISTFRLQFTHVSIQRW